MTSEVLIAIWPRGHDWMGWEIKFLTRGYGTHAAFIRPSGLIAENFLPHVRERAFRFGERKLVELYHLCGTDADDWAALDEWIRRELLNPPEYSVDDLFRYALNMPPRDSTACFCSQWVLRGLRECLAPDKQPLKRLEYQDFAPPNQLRSSPMLIPVDTIYPQSAPIPVQ
jgi:hypothetical protein